MKRFLMIGATALSLFIAGCTTSGPNAELKKGWEFMVAKDYAAARDHFEGMLAEYPDNPYVHLNLGVAYQELGETELARQQYRIAIAEGSTAEISTIAERGNVNTQPTTVADLAQKNLDTLGG